jgi:hypothetical protein
MITAIVFSRNRAMQLDALLTSMERFTPGVFEVTVSYKFDSESHRQAYLGVMRGHPKIWFQQRSILQQNVLHMLESSREHAAMFTDDDVFYRPISEEQMQIPEGCICFSPRLGLNTDWCYPMNAPQKVGELDFQYAWSIDGHVFRKHDLLEKVKSIKSYLTPNDLEAGMQDGKSYSIAYRDCSSLVNIPHNRVQNQYQNRFAGNSFEPLNQRFLAGERIDLQAMDFSNVRAAHQEIEYRFRQCQ